MDEIQKAIEAIISSKQHVLIMGAPGTGKSTCIKKAIEKKQMPVVAPTGVAAIVVGGQTIHSYFGIKTGKAWPEKKQRIISNWNVPSIIIDEISMLSGQVLDHLDHVGKEFRKVNPNYDFNKPLGGLRLVMVGDPLQLAPVNANWFFQSNVWKKIEQNLTVIILKKIMRTDNKAFAKLLGRCRKGIPRDSDIEFLLRNCKRKPDCNIPRILPTNKEADAWNDQCLRKCQEETGSEIIFYQSEPTNFHSVAITIGARVMLLINIMNEGLVNGSCGKVISMNSSLVKVEFDNGIVKDIGKVTRESNSFNIQTFLPLRLCWACSVHKFQGATLDKAYVDMANTFADHQALVAISRVKSPDDLIVVNCNASKFRLDNDAASFLKHYLDIDKKIDKTK